MSYIFLALAFPVIGLTGYSLGWWVRGRSIRGKVSEIAGKVESGKAKVQAAVDKYK